MFLRIMKLLPVIILSSFIASTHGDSIPVGNHSFESPVTQYVTPIVSDWDEVDTDPQSQDTGAFLNVPDQPSYVVNADANQVAYLVAELGNAFQQQLSQVYQVGKSYQLTMGVGISFYAPPQNPNDPLELAFYYFNDESQQNKDIARLFVPFERRSSTYLDDFTVNLPTVQSGYGWAGKNIGIAIRGMGTAGGTWVIDNVRVEEYPSIPNFTDDSIVNLADFAKMAAEWYLCGELLTDVTGEGCVNEADLQILMEYWLENV
jgi:hypothetical protein